MIKKNKTQEVKTLYLFDEVLCIWSTCMNVSWYSKQGRHTSELHGSSHSQLDCLFQEQQKDI